MNIRVFFRDGSSQICTSDTPILDALIPGLELTARQIFEEAGLI